MIIFAKFIISLNYSPMGFRLKGFLLRASKQLSLKAGYTVLRGDVRRSIRENVDGDELPPAHLVKNARVAANRVDVLQALPRGGTAVEVGVAYGDFTRHILDVIRPDHFIAIDTFGIQPEDEPWGRQLLKEQQCTHYDYYTRKFSPYIQEGKMTIKKGLSWEMLDQLPDQSVDYIYIDADHSYASVAREIGALKPKMKPQGIVHFNDYTYFDSDAMTAYGVPRAVHELMHRDGYEMLYLCLHPRGFYDVVVRKAPGC
jgi:hypothetical protein